MANEQVKDLTAALNEFKQGVGEYNQFTAVQQANEAVQKIRSSAENESNKRNALQGIANDLVSRLAMAGTPATTIQQVAGAIGPKALASPEQAALEGAVTGNEELVEQAVQADRALREPREEAQLKRDLIKAGAAEKALQAKADREATRLDVGSRDEITSGVNAIKSLNDLETEVQDINRIAQIGTRLGLARANARLAALKTKAEAYVVDFARAREKGVLTDSDLKRNQEIVGSIGDVSTLPALLGKWGALRDIGTNRLESRFSVLESEKKNMTNHRALLSSIQGQRGDRVQTKAPGAPQASGVRQIKKKDPKTGRTRTLEIRADGKARWVD